MSSPDQFFDRWALRWPAAARLVPLALLLPPFGFALTDPTRALAAMFLIFGLAVWTVLNRPHPGWVTVLTVLGFVVAALLPDRFSLIAYGLGVLCIALAGEGLVRR